MLSIQTNTVLSPSSIFLLVLEFALAFFPVMTIACIGSTISLHPLPTVSKTFCTAFPYTAAKDVNLQQVSNLVTVDQGAKKDPVKLKEFVLSKIKNASREVKGMLERTPLDSISCVKLKLRLPWNVLVGDIVRNNICVVGDALHPMTPDIGQGACSALEDSVFLARSLGEALLLKPGGGIADEEEEFRRIRNGVDRYGKERRFRSFLLICCAYLIGSIQESDNKMVSFLREKFLGRYTLVIVLGMADFDCGKLLFS